MLGKKMNDINLEHPECEYDFSEACEKLLYRCR